MSNADLFSLLKTYIDTRLSGIETSLTDTTHTLEIDVKKAENSFKFKGHQVHYELNVDLQDLVQRALEYLGRNNSEKAVTILNEALNTLKKRNKLIRISDKSEGRWKTVQEYLSDGLASDSEDKKKVRAADTLALKKLKSGKSADKKQNVRKIPAEAFGSTSQTAHNAIQFLSACRPFVGADLVTETRSKCPGKEICVLGVDYLDIGHPTAKKTPRLDLELPEEIRKDLSAHTDTLQVQDVYESYFEYEKGCSDIFVKDRQKNSVNFWKSINAPSFIVDIILNGYKIPLLKEPENM